MWQRMTENHCKQHCSRYHKTTGICKVQSENQPFIPWCPWALGCWSSQRTRRAGTKFTDTRENTFPNTRAATTSCFVFFFSHLIFQVLITLEFSLQPLPTCDLCYFPSKQWWQEYRMAEWNEQGKWASTNIFTVAYNQVGVEGALSGLLIRFRKI